MNFTESFQEFSSRTSTTDLALYAGFGIVLWVLFKDKLTPIQKFILDLTNKLKNKPGSNSLVDVKLPEVLPVSSLPKNDTEDTFFKLVVSWKQTRDLAEKSGCAEAVKVADQMFPFLSPVVCKKVTS